jgi:hypothetical protein
MGCMAGVDGMGGHGVTTMALTDIPSLFSG